MQAIGHCSVYDAGGVTFRKLPSPSFSPQSRFDCYFRRCKGQCQHTRKLRRIPLKFSRPKDVPRASSADAGSLRVLHAVAEPHTSGHLPVSSLHSVYYEVYGQRTGPTAVVIHGGPGAGCFPNHARFFDLSFWRVVLLDQRGCGRSTPRGLLHHNNTQTLVEDLELLRHHVGVEQWVLFGGSWGVALSLSYAVRYTHRVCGLVLRGVCLMRPCEIDWMYRGGVAALQPKGWQDFVGHLSPEERTDPLLGYYKLLTSDDPTVQEAAARHWMTLGMSVGHGTTSALQVWNGRQWNKFDFPTVLSASPPQPPTEPLNPPLASSPPSTAQNINNTTRNGGQEVGGVGSGSVEQNVASAAGDGSSPTPSGTQTKQRGQEVSSPGGSVIQALLECHYSINNGFLLDTPLLQDVQRVRSVPCIAVHGRLDFVCPVRTAYDLHTAWPEMELQVVPNAGHSMYHPAIRHMLLEATDRMKKLACWDSTGSTQPTDSSSTAPQDTCQPDVVVTTT